MTQQQLHVVTGAFGFSGKYIAARLLAAGHRVRTLTNTKPETDPHQGLVEVRPLNFADYSGLVEALKGAAVFYNTYWVRFNYGDFSYAGALENSRMLFAAVREAGVGRIVHISITNPSEDSPFEYFRDKAILEKLIIESGMSHAILRPAVLFGAEGILVNNIAWMLRRFPIFGVFGDGRYRLQPIHVDDLACLAVDQGQRRENRIINAIGPETFTFRDLVRMIGEAIGKKRRLVSISPGMAFSVVRKVGQMTGDILLTRDEIEGLMANLLYVEAEPAGTTRLSQWVEENRAVLGLKYASELARRGHN
jgi:NADH dehydrogenase